MYIFTAAIFIRMITPSHLHHVMELERNCDHIQQLLPAIAMCRSYKKHLADVSSRCSCCSTDHILHCIQLYKKSLLYKFKYVSKNKYNVLCFAET
jgi:hypothetical protein